MLWSVGLPNCVQFSFVTTCGMHYSYTVVTTRREEFRFQVQWRSVKQYLSFIRFINAQHHVLFSEERASSGQNTIGNIFREG